MARTPLTPVQRAANVQTAVNNLPALVRNAQQYGGLYGMTDARTLAAWEAVETAGAVVHRQSRLLAGKSKGG